MSLIPGLKMKVLNLRVLNQMDHCVIWSQPSSFQNSSDTASNSHFAAACCIRTFLSPVMTPTKDTGHFSLLAIFCSSILASGRTSRALLSWYSAPHSSRMLSVGSPIWKALAWIRPPVGSQISFRTLPGTYVIHIYSGTAGLRSSTV